MKVLKQVPRQRLKKEVSSMAKDTSPKLNTEPEDDVLEPSDDTTTARNRRGRGIAAVFVLLFLAAMVWGGFARINSNSDESKKSSPSNARAVESTSSTASTLTPDPMFKQEKGNNDGNKVDALFATKYAKATAKANNVAKAQRELLLANSANNAHRLAIWANAFGLYKDPNNWKPLVSGDYLSPAGQALYYRFEGALSATGTSVKEAQAPANYRNSGVSSKGTYGVSARTGITGNRKAIKVTLPNGTVVYVMVRCGNVPFPGKPGLPTVPTDELDKKDPSKDVGVNPKVADWKKDNTGGDASKGHKVSKTDDGATVSNALQRNPKADAAAAAAKAAVDAAAAAAAHQAAIDAAKVVDDNQSHVGTTPPAGW